MQIRLFLVLLMVCGMHSVCASQNDLSSSDEHAALALAEQSLDVIEMNNHFTTALGYLQKKFEKEQKRCHASLILRAGSSLALPGQTIEMLKQVSTEGARREMAMKEAVAALLKLKKAVDAIPKSDSFQENCHNSKSLLSFQALEDRFN